MSDCTIDGCVKQTLYKGLCRTHYNRVRVYGDPHAFKRVRHSGTDAERFWAKVNRTDGCWPWMAYKQPSGYGHFMTRDGRTNMAHRLAYELVKGAIPEGHQLDHVCHNRTCVNPDHLRPVTNKQNNENLMGAQSRNPYGLRGVGLNKRTNKYRARVQHNGRDHYAGEYETPEEAAEAAKQLRLSLFSHNDIDRKSA